MEHPILDPKNYNLSDIPAKNKSDAIFSRYKWGIPFDIQHFIRENVDELKNDLHNFFKKAYKNEMLKKQDLRFDPFKAFVSKCIRKTEIYNFTDEQITEIVETAGYRKPIDIGRAFFPEVDFDQEGRGFFNGIGASIKHIIQSFGIEYIGERGAYNVSVITENDYHPPETEDQIISRIKRYVPDCDFVKTTLNTFQRKCIRCLRGNLGSTRFLKIINSMRDVLSRQMFEEEYIKSIYDKPDLIAEDVNGYIDLCQEYVLQAEINERINVLSQDFRNTSEADSEAKTLRITISNEMSATQKQLNDCKARIQSSTKSLVNTREKRLDKESANEFSLFKIVLKVADENYRRLLLQAKSAWNLKLTKEMDNLSDADQATVGEVHGISIANILNFSHTPME